MLRAISHYINKLTKYFYLVSLLQFRMTSNHQPVGYKPTEIYARCTFFFMAISIATDIISSMLYSRIEE